MPEPVPPTIGGVPAGEAASLVERWEREWQAFPGLRAAVDLRVIRDGRAQRSAGVVLLTPTHLRFEMVAPLGLPTLVVSAGPERITVWSPTDAKAWTAPATAEAMSRFLGVPIRPQLLIRLLGGRAPLPPAEGVVRVVDDGGPHLAYGQGPLRQRIWVTPDARPARVQLDNGERLSATFEWTLSGALQSLTLALPRRSVEAYLRYISAEYASPPPEAFEITIPDGIPIQPID